jgi:hypothetical protein
MAPTANTTILTQPANPTLTWRILRRIEEKPGEDYRHLASYLEAKPNSVRNILSRKTRQRMILVEDSRYYADEYALAAAKLEEAAQHPAPRHSRLKLKLFVIGLVLAPIVGFGAAGWPIHLR